MKHLIQNVSYTKGGQAPFAGVLASSCKRFLACCLVLVLVCVTNTMSAQLSSNPTCEAGSVAFPDLSVTAGAVDLGQGDDVLFDATLPFAFSIVDAPADTEIDISTNGWIGADGQLSSDIVNSCPLPDTDADFRLAVYHDDLDMELGSVSSNVWTMSWAAGDAGHPGHPTAGTTLDAFMVHWNDAQDFPGVPAPAASDVFDFAAILYSDGSVVYLYDTNMSNADQAGASVYVQGAVGSVDAFSCNTAAQIDCDVLFLSAEPICADPITVLNCPIAQEIYADLSCLSSGPITPDVTGLVQFSNPCSANPVTITQSPVAGTTLPGGPYTAGAAGTITVTITDVDLNTYDCDVNFTLFDWAAPQLDCPTDQMQTIAASCELATVPDYTAGATIAGCAGAPTFTQTPAAGTLLSSLVGVTPADGDSYTVSISADDGNGNTTTCPDFTVTLDVTQPFTLSACPADVAQGTDATSCDAIVTWTEPTATAACGSAVDVDQSHSPGDTFPIGTTQVTYKFSDSNGNVELCFFDVLISDDDDPTIDSCPGDMTLTTDGDDCTVAHTYAVPTFEDNCGVVSVSLISGLAPDSDFPVGTTTVTWRASDAAGNTTDCTFDVTVTDDDAPQVLNCAAAVELNFNLDCASPNTPTLPDYSGLPQFTDNCGIVTVNQSPAAGTMLSTLTAVPFVDGATIPVTVTAMDAAGLSVSCTITATLNDNIGPHIACPSDQTVFTEDEGDGMCNINLPDFTGLAAAGVLCENEAATVTQSPLPTAGGGITYTNGDVITVTLTATDAASNTESCSFDVTFTDNTKPVLAPGVCMDPAPFTLAPGDCVASITLTPPTSGDNCDPNPIEHGVRSDGGPDLTAANGYTGDFSPCDTEVTWYSTDANGNVSDALCTVTVTVTEPDNQQNQPNAICKGVINLGLDDEGKVTLCAADVNDGSSDACTDDITLNIVRSDASGADLPGEVRTECITFGCDDIGDNWVCLKVTDCSGNESFCTSKVVIEEKRFPYIECPGEIQIECDVDNDGDPLPFVAGNLPAHLPNYPQANTPVDLAVLQAWAAAGYGIGNPSPGQDASMGITGLPLAYDNCGATISYENEYYLIDGTGPFSYTSDLPLNDPHECEHHNYDIKRTWTVTDNFGRSADCEQWIRVRDTKNPVIDPNGVADATLACDDAVGIAAALAPMPIAEDNCWLEQFEMIEDNSGAPEMLFPTNTSTDGDCIRWRITREWYAQDACGNDTNLIQIINLIDTVAPSISVTYGDSTYTGVGPHIITGVENDGGHCDAEMMFSWTGSDNCDELFLENYGFLFNGAPLNADIELLNDTYSFTRVFENGQTFMEVSATDACGNFVLMLFDITVGDTEPPTFDDCTGSPLTFFTSDVDTPTNNEVNGDCQARVRIEIPGFQDNCPLVVDGNSGSIEMMITEDPTAPVDAASNFFQYVGAWIDVTADGNSQKTGELPVGTHTVSFAMTDAAGNVAVDTCSYVINVIDDETPILECQLLLPLPVTTSGDTNPTDCVASFIDGHYGGVFGPTDNILPADLSDNCGYTATYTLSGATTGTGNFTYSPATILPPAPPSAPGLTFDLNVGNTSINYTVVDDAGNVIQCSIGVTVFDDVNPTITCPNDTAATTDPGVCAFNKDVSPIVADNCAVDYLTYTMTGGTAYSGTIAAADLPDTLANFDFMVGVTEVIYTVYDEQGNSESCTFNVTVTDEEDPVPACPGDYVVGTSGTIYVNGETGATMPIPAIPSGGLIYSSGDCETTIPGLNVITTDNCCVSSVQYRILNADGTIFQDWIAKANDPQVVDADLDLLNELDNQVFPKGDYTVEIRAWDCHMNEGVCDFNVSVFDDEKPAFMDCPGDQTVNTIATSCQQTVFWTQPADENVVDNCLTECGVDPIVGPWVSTTPDEDTDDEDTDVIIIEQSNGNAHADFPVGDRWVKYYVEDEHGNREYCIFKVTVVDHIAPTVANCPASVEVNFNLDCDQGMPLLDDYTGLPQFDDNCSIDSVTQSPAPGSALNTVFASIADGVSGTITVTATDLGGHTVDCIITLTLNDNVGPHIACPGDQNVYSEDYGDGNCMYTMPDFIGQATAGVLCGNEMATVTQDPAQGTLIDPDLSNPLMVTLTAADGSGNTEQCSFEITFMDNSAPSLMDPATCIDPTPVTLGIGSCEASVMVTPPVVIDNCDDSPLVIGLRDDGGDPLTAENSFTGVFSPCETVISWYALDADGNESETLCMSTVSVTEPINQLHQPVANCYNLTIGLNDNGEAIVCADNLDNSSYDDCTDDVTYTIAVADGNGQPIAGEPEVDCITYTCDDIGTNYVCLKVRDCSGNENFCTATITVEDKKNPYIACPADITIECDVDNDGDPMAYSGVLPAHAAMYPQANVPVDLAFYQMWLANYTATSPGQDAAAGVTGLPLAYDNCGATITYENVYYYYDENGVRVGPVDYYTELPTNDPHECAHHYYDIERVWTVTDAQGQSATCTQLIEVRDTEDPVIDPNGIADHTLECSDAAGIAAALAPMPTADDNCYLASFSLTFDNSGSPEVLDCGVTGFTSRITREWTAIDACGNTEVLTQIINLQDTTDPMLTVSANGSSFISGGTNTLVIDTDPGLCSAEVTFSLTATDNCDMDMFDGYLLAINGSPTPLTFLNGTTDFTAVLDKGNNVVQVILEDDCGNNDIVVIQAIVEDNEAPAFADCTEVTYTFFTSDEDAPAGEASNLDCEAYVSIEVPPFQDNCPIIMGMNSGQVQMVLTLAAGTSLDPADALYPYTLGFTDVTADAGDYINGGLPVGSHTVEFQMVDASGNFSSICSYKYDVIDDQNPSIDCPANIAVNLSDDIIDDTDCVFSFIDGQNGPATIIPLTEDNCEYTFDAEFTGATTISLTDIANPDGLDVDLNVGNTSITYTLTDNAGNTYQCSFSVVVFDDIDPVVTCPADISDVADAGVCYKNVDVSPSISDNCPGGSLEYLLSGATAMSGSIPVDATGALTSNILASIDANVGTTSVTYTYIDADGNSSSCSFEIDITDDQDPVLDCVDHSIIGTSGAVYKDPVNGIINSVADLVPAPYTGSDCEETVPWLSVTATDNCCVSSIQYQIIDNADGSIVQDWTVETNMPLPADGDQTIDLSNISFDKGHFIVNIRTWDCHMNEAICAMDVIVVDDEAPAFTDCPGDIVVNQLATACFQNVSWTEPAQDNVVDNCSEDCPIQDIVGPWVSFDADEDEDNVDTDVNINSQSNGNANAIFPVGKRYIKYYVEDESGNRTWCVFSVEVMDNIAPFVVSCPTDDIILTMDLDCDNTLNLADYSNAVSFSDICGVTSVSQSIYVAPGDPQLFFDGDAVTDGQEIQLMIQGADAAGQTAECMVTLVVEDNVGPYISCPAPQIIMASDAGAVNADCTVNIPDFSGLTTAGVLCNNEDATVTQSPAAGTSFSSMMFPMSVTMTATDDSGNSTQCTFVVSFVDDVAPALVSCGPDPADGLAPIGGCYANVALTPPTVSDCAIAPPFVYGLSDTGVMLNQANGYAGDFPACESIVTWYAVDMAGNSAEICTNTVTVFEPINENNEPTAACQAGIVLGLKNDGTVTLYADTYGQNSFDNCSNSDLTYEIHIVGSLDFNSELVFDCSMVGTHDICLRVTDCSGNSDLCFSTVTIQDKRDPWIICPADITIDCHNDNGGVPDHGGIADVITPFDQVQFDGYDNTTAQDDEAGITGSAQGWDNCGGTVTFSDVSTQDPDPTTCEHYSYTVTRTWTVTDAEGNDLDMDGNDCVQLITVQDVTAPYFTEAEGDLDQFINCDDPNYAARLSLAMAEEPTPMDLCYVTMTELPMQTLNNGCQTVDGQEKVFEQMVRTWRATDACGNFTDYVQYINIYDVAPPALTCPNNGTPLTYFTSNGTSATDCLADVNLVAQAFDCQDIIWSHEILDLSGGTSIVFSGGAYQFSHAVPPGDYCAKFIAADQCGNESECLFFFNVVDDMAPTLDCTTLPDADGDASNGAAVSISNDAGVCGASYTWTHPLASDNCGATVYCDYGDGAIAVSSATGTADFEVGTTTVTYYAEDADGNVSATCSFDVTVTDDEDPAIVCPVDDDITLYTSMDGFNVATYTCDMLYNWKSPWVDDNCEVVSYTIEIGSEPVADTYYDESHNYDFPVGVTLITYTAIDAAGNSDICTISITVIDDEDPVTLCADATVELDVAGSVTITGDDVDGGSYDNCNMTLSVSPDTFDCDDLGDHTVTMTATDDAGNSFWCLATVTVEDNMAPTISDCDDRTAAEDEGTCTYSVSGTAWDAAAADNCSATIVNDFTGTETLDGASFPTGSTTVTWTATDVAGNVTTCSHVVVITNPDLNEVCQDFINTNTLELSDDGTLFMTADQFDGGSGEACDALSFLISVDDGATFVADHTFDCDDVTLGTPMNIFVMVTDDNTGDSDVCLAQMSLTDGPVFVDFGGCPADVTMAAGAGECGADVSLPLPSVDGACPVISYSIDGGAFITADGSDVFFGIGTYTVDFAITNMSGDAGIVLGSGGTNLCTITVTVTGDASNTQGCDDPLASNYDPAAVCNDGSCIYPPTACVTSDQMPYGEDFEGTTGEWTQEVVGDDFDWTLNSGSTSTQGTGPDAASSGVQYLYMEASYPNYSSNAQLNSPCFDLLGASESSFSFAYHMEGDGIGNLELVVTTDGATYETLWSESGNQGADWMEATIDLSAYEGEMIELQFHGETTNDFNGDIAIDQFDLDAQEEPQECTGDITGDGVVDVNDFVVFNSAFGDVCADCAEDLNNDGVVDVNDFLALNTAFGSDCGAAVTGGDNFVQAILSKPGLEINKDLEAILMDMAELQFVLFPNPTTGENINVYVNDFVGVNEEVNIMVRDITGRILTTERLFGTGTGMTHELNFGQKLTSGVYTMTVESNGKMTSKRFTVE